MRNRNTVPLLGKEGPFAEQKSAEKIKGRDTDFWNRGQPAGFGNTKRNEATTAYVRLVYRHKNGAPPSLTKQ